MKRPHGGATDPSALDFSANVNPLGPPDGVRRVFERAEELAARYPSPDARKLCEAVARHHGIPAECVLAGNGSTDLIYLVARSLTGQRVRVCTPSFTEYEDACEACGIAVNAGGETATFVGNPNSPDGRLRTREEVRSLPGATLVVDEAFIDFVEDPPTLLREAAEDPRLIVFRSLTKFYALPGLRVGYLVAAHPVVARLRRLQPPWSVNGLAIAAGVAALCDDAFAAFSRGFVRERREELTRGLRDCGLEPFPASANFVLCRVADAARLCDDLLAHGIVARNCDSFTGLEPNRYVRFAVRKRGDNERLLSALKEVVQPCRA